MISERSTTVLAHGLGGSSDLPIPYIYALIGAAWALTLTFAVVVLAWKKPRFDAAKPGQPLPQWVTTAKEPATRSALAVLRLADPFGTGWLGDVRPYYLLSTHPSVLATLKVCFVVGGHVAGVIAAHDRALRLLPKRHQVTGQLATMLVMVGYTFTGLYLLFGG